MANVITDTLLVELQKAIIGDPSGDSLVRYASVSGVNNQLGFTPVNITGTVYALVSEKIVLEEWDPNFKFFIPEVVPGFNLMADSGVNSSINFFDASDVNFSTVNFSTFTGTPNGTFTISKPAGAVKVSILVIQNADAFQDFPSQYVDTFNEQAFTYYESELQELSFAAPSAANGLALNANEVFTINKTTDYNTRLTLFNIYRDTARTDQSFEIDLTPADFSADGTYTVTTLNFNFSLGT